MLLRISIFLVLSLFTLTNCNNSKRVIICTDENPSFKVLYNSEYGGTGTDEIFICENEESLGNAWNKIFINQFPKPELPNIDFNQKVLIIKNFQERRTGGFHAEVKSIQKENDDLFIMLDTTHPNADDIVTMAITDPILIIEVEKTGFKNVYFKP